MLRFVGRLATLFLAILGVADLVDDTPGLRLAALIGAVLVAGLASLLAVAAAEPDGIYPLYARRCPLPAVASAVEFALTRPAEVNVDELRLSHS